MDVLEKLPDNFRNLIGLGQVSKKCQVWVPVGHWSWVAFSTDERSSLDFSHSAQPWQMSLVDEQLPLWSIIVVEEQLGLASKAEELGSSCWLVWGSLMQKEYPSILSITSICGSGSSQKVWFEDH